MPVFKRRSASGGSDSPRITPRKAKNAVAVAKVIGPAVLPVLVPFATRTAGALRERWDRGKARRLGIPIEDLPRYSGRGGALHARITGAAAALEELRARPAATEDDMSFAAAHETTLRQLTAAVRAAERMPAPRRKAAHRAVSAELDQIEQRLLHRLGI
jgi:Family of unknown function (DUF6474)